MPNSVCRISGVEVTGARNRDVPNSVCRVSGVVETGRGDRDVPDSVCRISGVVETGGRGRDFSLIVWVSFSRMGTLTHYVQVD